MRFFDKIIRWSEVHNPYNSWKKVSKYFKKPRCVVSFGKWQGEGVGHYFFDSNPLRWIVDVQSWDVIYKDKTTFDKDINISFEQEPQISILFFKHWHLWFRFLPEIDKTDFYSEMIYWETIIEMNVYKKNLFESISDNTYTTFKKEGEEKINIKNNVYYDGLLTDYGKEMFFVQMAQKMEEDFENC